MRTIYKLLVIIGLFFGISCQDEGTLSPEFTYTGPIPEISQGNTEAQKICYELYKDYDLHVYYTLSGDDALRSDVGKIQTLDIEKADETKELYLVEFEIDLGPAALPMQSGDEVTATSFLKLLKIFYNTLPEKMAKTSTLKRHVLVKVVPVFSKLFDAAGVDHYTLIAYSEAMQGIVYYGGMDDEAWNDEFTWKHNIAYEYFKGMVDHYYKEVSIATEFGLISEELYASDQGDYYAENIMDWDMFEVDEDQLMEWGFVDADAYLAGSTKDKMYTEDLASYLAWIACLPLSERQDYLDNYPLVKAKYELAVKYMKENYNMDMEALSKVWASASSME